MNENKKHIVKGEIHIGYCGKISKIIRANYSVESSDNKPYDISMMTGNNIQNESEDDEQ